MKRTFVRWTQEDAEAYVGMVVSGMTHREIAIQMGRTVLSLNCFRKKLLGLGVPCPKPKRARHPRIGFSSLDLDALRDICGKRSPSGEES